MATETYTITKKTDDYEAKQGRLEVKAENTIPFEFKGSGPREIDLSEVNESQFIQDMQKWLDASRPVTKRGGGRKASSGTSSQTQGQSKPKSGSATEDRAHNQEVRDWWKIVAGEVDDDGQTVSTGTSPSSVPKFSTRGRIPGTVNELFEATGGDSSKEVVERHASGASTPAASSDSASMTPEPEQAPDEAPDVTDEPQQQVTESEPDEDLPEGYKRWPDGVVRDEEGYPHQSDDFDTAGV